MPGTSTVFELVFSNPENHTSKRMGRGSGGPPHPPMYSALAFGTHEVKGNGPVAVYVAHCCMPVSATELGSNWSNLHRTMPRRHRTGTTRGSKSLVTHNFFLAGVLDQRKTGIIRVGSYRSGAVTTVALRQAQQSPASRRASFGWRRYPAAFAASPASMFASSTRTTPFNDRAAQAPRAPSALRAVCTR
jgi:hypothetical protein